MSELAGEVCVCVSVLGKGVCAPGTCLGGLVPYGRLQAGSSWRGGGAAAGAVAALLSVSVLKPGIDWVRIPHPIEVWLLLPSAGPVIRVPLSRSLDQIGFLDL